MTTAPLDFCSLVITALSRKLEAQTSLRGLTASTPSVSVVTRYNEYIETLRNEDILHVFPGSYATCNPAMLGELYFSLTAMMLSWD